MDRLWWSHITKAHKFAEDIVSTAASGMSVALTLPEQLPWRNTLAELVEDELKRENPKNSFEMFSCPEEEAGAFLLNRYCREETKAAYRYGMTYAAFLGQREDTVLNDRYLWIRDIPEEKCGGWLDFVAEYRKNVTRKTPAVFILEVKEGKSFHKAGKGIKRLRFDQNIGAYDKFAFCALAATENKCRNYLRPYLAELVSTICKEDVELCAACVSLGSRFLADPAGAIDEIVKEKYRSDGERYAFSKTEGEIRKRIWEAQLKNIFPVIEKYRGSFIQKHYEAIKKSLPVRNSSGEEIRLPEDVEVGTLLYLAGSGAVFLDKREYEELKEYREARNALAHLEILELKAVDSILKKADSASCIQT